MNVPATALPETTMEDAKAPDGALEEGEICLLLDGEFLVAVSVVCKRNAVNSIVTWTARARALEKDGTPMLDAHLQPITASHPRSCPSTQVEAMGGEDVIAKEAILIVLGDAQSLQGDLAGADMNIRSAIAVSDHTGAKDLTFASLTDFVAQVKKAAEEDAALPKS